MTDTHLVDALAGLSDQIDVPRSGEQLYDRLTARISRRRRNRRRGLVLGAAAIVASAVSVVGGVWNEPTRYASAGSPAPAQGIAAEGVFRGQVWTVGAAVSRHCDDPSQDMLDFTPRPGGPPARYLPKAPAFRINVRARYGGRLITDVCDGYPFYAALWPDFGPLINYGGGVGQVWGLSNTRVGVFTGWTQPNVAWVRVNFSNGQHLTAKTIDVGAGVTLRFFGYIADNRLNVGHLDGFDTAGKYLGHVGGKN